MPLGFGGVGGGYNSLALGVDEREIGDADHASARVPLRVTEGVELLQVDISHSDLFLQFTLRRLFQRFVNIHETAGQGPPPLERLLPAPDEQNFQIVFGDGEDHQIDSDRGPWVIAEFTHLRARVSLPYLESPLVSHTGIFNTSSVVLNSPPAARISSIVREVASSATPRTASSTSTTRAPASDSPSAQARTQ